MKVNRVLIYIKAFFKVCLYTVMLLVSLELGLQLRAYLKQKAIIKNNVGSSILMIGDSVLGNAGESGSIYEQLSEKLKKKTDGHYYLVDASSKANFTAQASYLVDKLVEKNHPVLSIVLLGGSDLDASPDTYKMKFGSIHYFKNIFYRTYLFKMYVSLTAQVKMSYLKRPPFLGTHERDSLKRETRTLEASQRQEALYHDYLKGKLSCTDTAKLGELTAVFFEEQALDILKKAEECVTHPKADEPTYLINLFIAKAYRELNAAQKASVYFTKALEKNPNPEIVYINLFWVKYSVKDCAGMFSAFEDVIKVREPGRTMIWGLRRCFAEENKYEEGAEFFKKLAERSKKNRNLSLLLAESLISDKSSAQPFLESLDPENGDYYLSLLQYYKMNSMPREANHLYLKKDLYISSNQEAVDLKNFRELVEKLTKNGSKVLVLQYPNQPDWQILEAIAPFNENVKFLSLSSVFEKNLDNYSILDLLSDDFIHVSPLGAGVIADELSRQIDSILK